MQVKDKVWVFGIHPGVITKKRSLNATTLEPHYQVSWKTEAGVRLIAYVHEKDLTLEKKK